MSDDFSMPEPGVFDSYYHYDDDDEHEELMRQDDQAALEAMQEAAEEFSSFDNSSSEEDTASDADDVQDGSHRDTQEGVQPGVNLNPPTQTFFPTTGSQREMQSMLESLMPHSSGVSTPQGLPPAARPGVASTNAVTSPIEAPAPVPSQHVMSSASRDGWNVQPTLGNTEVHDGGDGQFVQYKVHYRKPGLDTLDEEQFYLDNENVEFLRIDGPEHQRTYEQLEVLYRARGREIEELTRTMEEKDEEKSREIRNLKHRLAIASGEVEAVNDSLRQGQQLLQQAKSDNTDAGGKVRALEAQLSSLRDTKQELIQKLQTAESTIENMTHHIEELQKSESLSRARNEHEAVIASLTGRHERELLVVREKLDACKTSLGAKEEELAHVNSQLADTTRELEMTRVGKAETINRLNRSLEESQRQCQAMLEQSSSQEASLMRVQLQQAVASKRISEDLCQTFQRDIKELKEQLNMYESASQLGVFAASSHSASRPTHDDSIADLGIRKTLNFESPQALTRADGTAASLRSELERCLGRNRQQRGDLGQAAERIKGLQEELQEARSRAASLENTCEDQQARLQELGSLNKPGDAGVKAVEARQRREIDDLKRDMNALLADIEDYKTRLQEVGDSEAKLAEINAELNQQIAQMVNDFDLDKQAALQSCQRTMEAVNRQSFDKLRQDIEERFQSEKAMLVGDSKRKLDNLNQALRSTQTELDNVKALYVRTCEEHSQREVELKETHRAQLEEQLGMIKDKLEKEKREWESFMRAKMEKEQEEFKTSLRQTFKLNEGSHRNMEIMISPDQLTSTTGQQAQVKQALADARRQWETARDRDIQQWTSERTAYEVKISRINEELSEYKQKLDLALSEKMSFQKHAEDSKLDYQTKMTTVTEKHKQEIGDIVVKYDRRMREFEEKLVEMYEQSATSLINKLGSVANLPQSFRESDLQGKLRILEKIMKEKDARLQDLEKIMNEKDARLQELEKINQEQKDVVLNKVSTNNNHLVDFDGSFVGFECYHGDLSEASAEKLREHIKKLESVLHTMKQKCNREVNELKQQHQKESETSVRLREEKFQAELRYFLKEKEDQWKTRMETAAKQHEQALKQADEKHECVIRETICDYEHKNAKLQKVIDEYNQIRSDKEKIPCEATSIEDTFSPGDKMKREIVLLEKYIAEKTTLERKVKQIEEEKGDEIVNLCLRQAEEERKLKETFDAEVSSLKVEHQNVIRHLEQEVSSQKSEVDKARELIESLQKEKESDNLVVAQLKNEVEQMKVSVSNKQTKEQMKEQMNEQRVKWFQEAREYINREIKHGVEEKMNKEIKQGVEEKMKKEEEKMREKLEMIKEAEERLRKQLEKMNEEGEKMREKQEKIKEEEERMKKEQENIKEWQKNKEKFEIEKKDAARKIAQVEVDKLNKKFVVELNARVEAIRTQVEQQKMAWQEEERRKLLEEREKIIKALRSHMERSLQETKSQLETKMEEVKDNELRDIQEGMREQIQSMQEGWTRERNDHDNRTQEELQRLKECYQVEVDARLKACQERELAVDHAQRRELLFREEEQRLKSGIQKCQADVEQARERHEAVAEQVNALDRKHKVAVKKLKAKHHQETAQLKAKHVEEKDSLMTCFRTHYDGELEKVRTQAELARAALAVELENLTRLNLLAVKVPHPGAINVASLKSQEHQHLSTGASIPAEKLAQLCSACPPTPAPVIGTEVIDMFKVRVKAGIRSALSQKVPEGTITALEYSLDELSEQVKSLVAKHPGPASGRPGPSRYNSPWQKQSDDDDGVMEGKQTSCQPCSETFIKNMAALDRHLQPYHHTYHSHTNCEKLLQPQNSHPQLDEMGLFDSDTYRHSPSAVNNSSPAGHTCARSYLTPVSRKQNTPASYTPQLSPNVAADTRTMPTKLDATYETKDESPGLASARDERRRVEARVRLENWAQTGATPWKASREVLGGQRRDAGGFLKPGLDAEQWAGQPEDNSQFLTSSGKHANVTKHGSYYYNHARVSSESLFQSSVSSNASTSFVTLKSDDTD